jgi:hypothetical protein
MFAKRQGEEKQEEFLIARTRVSKPPSQGHSSLSVIRGGSSRSFTKVFDVKESAKTVGVDPNDEAAVRRFQDLIGRRGIFQRHPPPFKTTGL